MRTPTLLCALLCALLVPFAHAQQDGLLQLDDDLDRFLLRQQTLGLLPDAHLTQRPLSAYEARAYLDTLAARRGALAGVDRKLLARFRGEMPGPGVGRVRRLAPWLYRNGQDLIAVGGERYALQVTPLLYLTYGQARRTGPAGAGGSAAVWQNTRGVRAGGHIGRYLFFESRIEENQRRDADPVDPDLVKRTVPRLAAVDFGEGTYDYTIAMGILGVRTRHFEVRFGRDRNFWGPGQTSLILSGYAPAYDQLQIRTTVWRVRYTNLYTAFEDLSDLPLAFQLRGVIPRKYGAFHHLALDLPGGVQAELFEGIAFSTPDSLGRRAGGFELAYLNPVIFYAAVEKDRGSPDNGFIGGGLSWVTPFDVKLYTQLLVDDIDLSRLGEGFSRNRTGWLLGAHLAGLPGLSVYLEYARLRPFLYSHRDPSKAFVHWNDVLGHPAGPNAQDFSLQLVYRPRPRLLFALNAAHTQHGRNPEGQNIGGDPLEDADTREGEVGYDLLGGVRQDRWLLEAHAGYELLPELFLEAALRVASVDDAERGLDRYVAPYLMLRWALPFQSRRY